MHLSVVFVFSSVLLSVLLDPAAESGGGRWHYGTADARQANL